MREKRTGSAVMVELVRLVVVLTFTAVGYSWGKELATSLESVRIILGAILGAATGYVIGGVLGRSIERVVTGLERRIEEVQGADIVAGGLGLIGASFATGLILWPLLFLPTRIVGVATLGFTVVVSGYVGFRAGIAKREDMLQLFGLSWRTRAGDLRIMDSSAILDTRLLDCVRAGFLKGPMIVPEFVLEEVQAIADSGDSVKRARGRRGLETLTALRRDRMVDLRVVSDRTFPEFSEVDAKVIALARERGGSIVTNDTALSRIAELQGIEVLSLNVLAEALRPPVLPGEEVALHLQKEGREAGQAVGYLEDGTMVVVEDGRRLIGHDIHATVTSILQTSGGRMIFARRHAEARPDSA